METLINAEELAKILNLSKQQIWILSRDGIIPHFRVGRAIRYNLQEVLEALRSESQSN